MHVAMMFSIIHLSITTLSITITFSIMALSIMTPLSECCVEYRVCFIVVVSVNMLNVIGLNVEMLSTIMLSVATLSAMVPLCTTHIVLDQYTACQRPSFQAYLFCKRGRVYRLSFMLCHPRPWHYYSCVAYCGWGNPNRNDTYSVASSN